jgi:hypothetical protein
VQQASVEFYISYDKTSFTQAKGGGVLLHTLFLALLIYSQLLHTYIIRQEMDDYKWKSVEEIRVYLGYYTNIHRKKNKQDTFFLPRRFKMGNLQICVKTSGHYNTWYNKYQD